MGYAHYYHGMYATPELAEDTKAILRAARDQGISVRGPDGTGEPEVTGTCIAFNGAAAAGEALDGFWLGTDEAAFPAFTNTERLPYDTVVTAVLSAGFARTGVPPRSDGTPEDWAAGIALYEQACGPLSPDVLGQLQSAVTPGGLPFTPEEDKRFLAAVRAFAQQGRPVPGPGGAGTTVRGGSPDSPAPGDGGPGFPGPGTRDRHPGSALSEVTGQFIDMHESRGPEGPGNPEDLRRAIRHALNPGREQDGPGPGNRAARPEPPGLG